MLPRLAYSVSVVELIGHCSVSLGREIVGHHMLLHITSSRAIDNVECIGSCPGMYSCCIDFKLIPFMFEQYFIALQYIT